MLPTLPVLHLHGLCRGVLLQQDLDSFTRSKPHSKHQRCASFFVAQIAIGIELHQQSANLEMPLC